MKALIKTGAKMLKGLFNKNKMDVDKTVEKAGDVIQSASNKEQGTRRLNIDMLSDSWLSKNVRPIIVLWALCMLTFIIVGGALGLVIDSAESNPVGTIAIIAVTFYFPLRSAEKYLRNRAKKL